MSRPDETRGPAAPTRPEADEPPPFLGTWGRLYAAVIGWLAALIALFYLITISFS